MKAWICGALLSLLPLVSLASDVNCSVAAAGGQRAEWQAWRGFLAEAREHARFEHVLPPNSDREILRLQKWTKGYEGYTAKQANSGPLVQYYYRRGLKRDPELSELRDLYAVFYKKAAQEIPVLLHQFAIHRGMILDPVYAEDYGRRFQTTLRSIVSGRYQAFDCDYLNQPTNALYFDLNALRVIEDLGRARFGACWDSAAVELHKPLLEWKP